MQAVHRLFIAGLLLAMLWEAPLSAPGWLQEPSKLLRLLQPVSVVSLLAFCSWDAVIMLVRCASQACLFPGGTPNHMLRMHTDFNRNLSAPHIVIQSLVVSCWIRSASISVVGI
jgi:hypothetical protein